MTAETTTFRERRQRRPGDKPVFNLTNIDGAFTLAFNAKMARLLLDAIDASGDDLNAALFSLAEKLEDGVKWADKFKSERDARKAGRTDETDETDDEDDSEAPELTPTDESDESDVEAAEPVETKEAV